MESKMNDAFLSTKFEGLCCGGVYYRDFGLVEFLNVMIGDNKNPVGINFEKDSDVIEIFYKEIKGENNEVSKHF